MCVCLTVQRFLANVAIVCYCCVLSILLLFDSSEEVETVYFSFLGTLAPPVATPFGVPARRGGVRTRDSSANFGRGGG